MDPIQERNGKMKALLEKNPFILDEELSKLLGVSIHTIRSDRKKMGIPEVRKRGQDLSESLFAHSQTLSDQEIIGEILEIEIDKAGLSLLQTDEKMGFQKSGIIRGHILFAQANSLAIAIVDAEVAVTGKTIVEFLAPAHVGEKILAKAKVLEKKNRKREVEVILKTPKRVVMEGRFFVYCLTQDMAKHLHLINDEEITGGMI